MNDQQRITEDDERAVAWALRHVTGGAGGYVPHDGALCREVTRLLQAAVQRQRDFDAMRLEFRESRAACEWLLRAPLAPLVAVVPPKVTEAARAAARRWVQTPTTYTEDDLAQHFAEFAAEQVALARQADCV